MDAGTYNASVQFENYAYNNMSGVTTEHSEIRSNAIQGENHLNNSYDGIEYVSENYDDDFELQDVEINDYEIIAIDPNSFYSETTSSSDSSASEEENDHEELSVTAFPTFDFPHYAGLPSNDDLDIITLNIDEDFPLDTQEEILFKNDLQFDLASYIGGESTSLLMSPMNDVSARRRLMSLSDFGHLEGHNLVTATKTANNLSRMPVVQTNTVHDKAVAKTPASNRRKRKNLSREFIETSDSDADNETKSINVIENSKHNKAMKPRKENDPVWNSIVDKRTAKALKPAPVRTKEMAETKESIEAKKMAKNTQPTQGNGLRNIIKQQLLSDRPVTKNKLLKTMSMPSGACEKQIPSKVLPHPVKRLGVGRGKDIEITAKYYNVNEPSDNNERDKSVKQDRFHQIYTDSDTTSQSESDSGSDDLDIEVNSEPSPPAKTAVKEKACHVVENVSNKEKPRENNAKKKSSGKQLVKKSIDSKTTANDKRKSMIIESQSMDSTDFAKALVTNAKIITKTKSNVTKKNNLEQQKRIIQSNILLHNPAKFKFITNESKSPSNGIESSMVEKSGSSMVEHKPVPVKPVQVSSVTVTKDNPSKSVNSFTDVQPEKAKMNETSCHSTNEQQIKIEHNAKHTNEVQINQEIQDDVKPDAMSVEENKFETSAKRKLNIQEYLKRKSLKTSPNGHAGVKNDLVHIKSNPIENGTQHESNKRCDTAGNDESSPNNSFTGNSMYEEIIIVSMGCNTDISIPASFAQPSEVKSTVLLSDIQTSVEKANSKISCMSLISSIQDVILKKTHSIEQNVKKEAASGDSLASHNNEQTPEEEPEHGENKVIMHLRKDRVRPTRASTSIQTDSYFQFPPLEKLASLSKKQTNMTEKRVGSIPRELQILHYETKSKAQRNYRGPNHLSESSYYSDDDEDKSIQRRSRHSDFVEHNNGRYRRVRRESSRYSSSKYDRYINRNRTISRSLSSSSDNSTTSNDSSSSSQSSTSSSSYVSSASERSLNSYGGSSSKSYYADDHKYYRKRTISNNSRRSNYKHGQSKRNRSPEERRIVYVGRIEEDATKEELRRKFSVYGKVKQVSVHNKDTKMKYGFVTFVRPCDAYTAIDESSKNSAICHYDISFGGRRAFCREKYFDLDNTGASKYHDDTISPQKPIKENDDSFEALLRKVKEKLQEKK